MVEADKLVEEHESLWKLLERHEHKLKNYHSRVNDNTNAAVISHVWNKSQNAKETHHIRGIRGVTDEKVQELG